MLKTIANKEVDVNEEGYLTNKGDWNEDIAKEIAKELGINDLTEKHWAVIKWLRDQDAGGTHLSIRQVGSSGLVDIKEFYALFPGGPLKNASKIAGIMKPMSCL
ncbi:MAG: dissimilatory sulfite reductase related protein [Patescibacteria group bacterium]|nr:dissimilatory sulfite reductase related protein [Patescibacteria group bacterium]